MSNELEYRYPGPEPFRTDQRRQFFGRDAELDRLFDLVQLHQQVLLYSKSGIGKSSLLNAGLIPLIEEMAAETNTQVRILPVRIHAWVDDESDTPLQAVEDRLGSIPRTYLDQVVAQEGSLWYQFKALSLVNPDCTYFLVFDQFEELFTHPESSMEAFKRQMGDLLYRNVPQHFRSILEIRRQEVADILSDAEYSAFYAPLKVKVIYAIREDRYSELNRLTDHLPDIYRNHFQLKPLNWTQAEEAIVKPAKLPGDYLSETFVYESDAVTQILEHLSGGKFLDVEPTQLQVLCGHFERLGKSLITLNDVPAFNDIFLKFYLDCIASLEPVDQFPTRKFIEDLMIIKGHRIAYHRLVCLEQIPERVLDLLLNVWHLLRTEVSSTGGVSYEISHDTLVAPILMAKKLREDGNISLKISESQQGRKPEIGKVEDHANSTITKFNANFKRAEGDSLFILIKNLSPSEKRYFKISRNPSTQGRNPEFLRLFHAMDSLAHYDKEALRSALKDNYDLKFLAQGKRYLYQKILDSLRIYWGASSVEAMLSRMLEEFDILYKKGLGEQGERILRKAKILAETHDCLSQTVDILAKERMLSIEIDHTGLEDTLMRIDDAQRIAISKLENLHQFQKVWDELYCQHLRYGIYEFNPTPNEQEGIRKTEILSNIESAKTFLAKHLFLLSAGLLAKQRGEWEMASTSYTKLIQMWQDHPDRIKERGNEYSKAIYYYLIMQLSRGYYSEFYTLLNTLEAISIGNFIDAVRRFEQITVVKLLYYLNHEIFQSNSNSHQPFEIEEMDAFQRYGSSFFPATGLFIQYSLMMVRFFWEDWRAANRYRMQIEDNEYARTGNRHVVDFAKLIQLIVVFEQGDFSWLESLCQRHKLSMQRGGRRNRFYSIFIRGLQRLVGEPMEMARPIFQKIEVELGTDYENGAEGNILGANELLAWIRYKIDGNRPLRDFVKRKGPSLDDQFTNIL